MSYPRFMLAQGTDLIVNSKQQFQTTLVAFPEYGVS